ncbi:primosomal protein [Demequina muriae]|uniref:Primosomal protein n=1 Tax=Demequina muriae TaxID=3051664 RepID=A0ABT8GD56_9MICO|nr:primosomal protein [Demequina sp. EGI L300058]MDN4479353.1 primosomal protein [Demequina sp. EGI L300058]
MSAEATEALRRLMAALEEHLEAIAMRRGDADAAVDDAYEAVATEFERYEDALDSEYGETLPIVLDDSEGDEYEGDDDADDGEDEDEDTDGSSDDPDGDETLDPHAVEDDDDMDDDIDEFDLR